jgi:hypothetical protein
VAAVFAFVAAGGIGLCLVRCNNILTSLLLSSVFFSRRFSNRNLIYYLVSSRFADLLFIWEFAVLFLLYISVTTFRHDLTPSRHYHQLPHSTPTKNFFFSAGINQERSWSHTKQTKLTGSPIETSTLRAREAFFLREKFEKQKESAKSLSFASTTSQKHSSPTISYHAVFLSSHAV